MEEIVFGIGITALAGALATVAGAAEDTESDIGSQGDPNSQVQLAPQMGYIHRIFNKAIAGEPPAYGLWVALGAGLAWAFMAMHINPILAIVLGSALAVFVQGVYATTAYLGRTASLAKFGQPVYIDILKSMTTVTMAHAFVAIFTTVAMCHLIISALGHPFPPVLRKGAAVPGAEVRSRSSDLRVRQHRPLRRSRPAKLARQWFLQRQTRRPCVGYLFRPDRFLRALAYRGLRAVRRRMGSGRRRHHRDPGLCHHRPLHRGLGKEDLRALYGS